LKKNEALEREEKRLQAEIAKEEKVNQDLLKKVK